MKWILLLGKSLGGLGVRGWLGNNLRLCEPWTCRWRRRGFELLEKLGCIILSLELPNKDIGSNG